MNPDAMKDFMFRHVEKFVFGVLTLLSAFLIYQGVQKPDIMKKHKPEAMEQQANQVKVSIDDDHWTTLASQEQRITKYDIVAKTNESMKQVNSNTYSLRVPWEFKEVDSSLKRSDPKLPVPVELQVTGVIASIAKKSTGEYALKLLEPADEVEKVEKKEKRPSKREERMNKMMMGGEGGYGGMGGMGMEGMGGSGMGGMGGMGMEGYGGSGMPGGMSGPGGGMAGPGGTSGPGGMTTAKAGRKLDSKLYDQGFRPTSTGKDEPMLAQFIAGVALMPQKQIYAAYEEALSQADGYVMQRDQPFYLGFQLQRADVTAKPVDQLVDADWTARGNSRYFQQLLLKVWSGMAKEIVAGKYRDPELTAAIPPVLLDHYGWFAVHPKIPVGDEPLPGTSLNPVVEDAVPAGPVLPDAADDPFAARGRTGGAAMGMEGGFGGMAGMDTGGYGGYGGFNMGAGMSKVDQPEFKLIRFYDFADFSGTDPGAPKPGRKYVYRIRIAVEDPNFPSNPMSQPKNSTLSADVYKRVEKLTAEATATKKRNFTKWSDYSAPSPVISLPGPYESFAGSVDPGISKAYPGEASTIVEFQSKPPRGKVVVAKWDPQYGVRIPVFVDVSKGSVVAKTGTFDIPDPITFEIKKSPEMTLNTSNVVLDLSGGKPLQISPAEDQTEPGMFLMFDPAGGLEVVDEIETQRGYRLYSAADERGE